MSDPKQKNRMLQK